MSFDTQRRILRLVAIVVLLITLGTMISRAFHAPTVAARAQTWANSLSEEQLVGISRHIESLPPEYQKAVYGRAPAERAAIWASHLKSYAAAHPALSASQRQFIDSVITGLTNDLYIPSTGRQSADQIAALDAVNAKAHTLFSRDEATRIFAQLSPREGNVPEPGVNRLVAVIARYTTVSAEPMPACECSTNSDWCDSLCVLPTQQCAIIYAIQCGYIFGCSNGNGCGTFWMYDCNGMCF